MTKWVSECDLNVMPGIAIDYSIRKSVVLFDHCRCCMYASFLCKQAYFIEKMHWDFSQNFAVQGESCLLNVYSFARNSVNMLISFYF